MYMAARYVMSAYWPEGVEGLSIWDFFHFGISYYRWNPPMG